MRKYLSVFLVLALVLGMAGTSQSAAPAVNEREIVAAYGSLPSSGFNPWANANRYEGWFNQHLYDSLVTLDNAGNVIPSAAESYSISDDGKTYTFNLKKGMTFSNGEEVKASDVKFSLQSAKDCTYIVGGYESVDSFEAPDDYTVIIRMNVAEYAFLEKMARGYQRILSEAAYKEFGENYGKSPETTVGSGPYILTGWQPDVEVTLEANANYHGGAPDIKKVRYQAITDQNAAIIALQTGDIDLYQEDISGVYMDTIRNDPNLTLSEYIGGYHIYVPLNIEKAPFDNLEVRKAIAYAVDRKKAVLVATENTGRLADNPGVKGWSGVPENFKPWYDMDVEKAAQIIKDAGLEGETVILKTFEWGPLIEAATSVQADLAKIGLDVQVQVLEYNTFLTETRRTGNFQLAVTRMSTYTHDMDEIMDLHVNSNSINRYNYSRFSNPEVDALLAQARGEMDRKKREDLYAKIIEIYVDNAIEVPLFHIAGAMGHTKDLVIDTDMMNVRGGNFLVDYKWAK